MLTYPEFTPQFPRSQWTMPAVLEHHARVSGDRPFLQWQEDAPFSYAQVNAIANRLARGFQELGVKQGDYAVIFMPNCLEFLFTWYAINKLGAVEAPINIAYRDSFLEHQVNICDAETIVTTDGLLPAVEASLPKLRKVKRIIVHGGRPDRTAIGSVTLHAFADVHADDDSNLDVQVLPTDISAILFTSGTTGLSKGVMLPHSQHYFFAEQTVQLVGLTADDVYMTGFPLFHANAHFMSVYPAMVMGAKCVVYEKFSASQWVDRLHKSGATVTNSLGVTLPFIYSQPPTDRDGTHKLRCFFTAPTPSEILEDFRKRFNIPEFIEGFGMTETCMGIMSPRGIPRPKGACGVHVSQWFDIRIVDPDTDMEVPVGEIGELVLRPKTPGTLSAGYINMPEKRVESTRNLWFHTGDALRRDAEGWYYFVDRMNDAIRRRGENISSFEVEHPIRDHPAVADVAIVAAPSGIEGGEDEIKVCLILHEGHALDHGQFVLWCEERLPHFAVPRFVEILNEFPKTPSERVQKKVLRERGIDGAWDRVAAGVKLRIEQDRKAGR